MFQSATGCAIKFNFCLFIYCHGRNQIEFRDGQVALGSHGLIIRSRSESLLFLHDLERALRQIPRLCAAATRAPVCSSAYCAFRTSMRICFLNCSDSQFGLPVFQLRAVLIRLGHAVSYRDVYVQTNVVIRRRIIECILKATGKSAGTVEELGLRKV